MGVSNPVPLNTLIKIYSNLVVHMIYLTIGVWNRIRWFGSWYVDRHNSITFHAWYLLIYIIYHGSVIKKTYIFSSPELKAQVSFSDHLSSVVCQSVCPSVCKLFTFSSSSPEPLDQFQSNLAQSILGWRGFKFVQMKFPNLPKGEIIGK